MYMETTTVGNKAEGGCQVRHIKGPKLINIAIMPPNYNVINCCYGNRMFECLNPKPQTTMSVT